MDYKNSDEREVNLKSMLFAMLYQWKKILVVGVVLALALGGFRFCRALAQMRDADAAATTQTTVLEEDQKAAQETEPPAETVVSLGSAVMDGIKWAILGGVAGVLAVCFVACIGFICGDRVFSGGELKDRFGLKIMGSVCGEQEKSDRLTRWLKRKEGRLMENSPENEALLAANLRNYCRNAGTVLVSGDLDGEAAEAFAGELKRLLPDIRFECHGSLVKDPEAVRKLPECDGVLLVAICGASRYSHVENALERVTDAGKPVIGCVVVEA